MAREVLVGDQYSKSSDVYSFGVILWELTYKFCHGGVYMAPWSNLYDEMTEFEVRKAIVQGRGLEIPTG